MMGFPSSLSYTRLKQLQCINNHSSFKIQMSVFIGFDVEIQHYRLTCCYKKCKKKIFILQILKKISPNYKRLKMLDKMLM